MYEIKVDKLSVILFLNAQLQKEGKTEIDDTTGIIKLILPHGEKFLISVENVEEGF